MTKWLQMEWMLATWSSGNPRALVNEPLRRYSAVILSNCLQSVDSQLTVLQNFSFRQMVYIILNQTCQMHPTCRIVSKWPTFSKTVTWFDTISSQVIFLYLEKKLELLQKMVVIATFIFFRGSISGENAALGAAPDAKLGNPIVYPRKICRNIWLQNRQLSISWVLIVKSERKRRNNRK